MIVSRTRIGSGYPATLRRARSARSTHALPRRLWTIAGSTESTASTGKAAKIAEG